MKDHIDMTELKKCAFDGQDLIQSIKRRAYRLGDCISSIRAVDGLSDDQLDLVLEGEAAVKELEAFAYATHVKLSGLLKAIDTAVAGEATRRR